MFGYKNSTLLFVGEGNFSFSCGLATSPEFGDLNCKLLATDFVPELKDELKDNRDESDLPSKKSFTKAILKENVRQLEVLGHQVLFDVDATKIQDHSEVISVLRTGSCENIFIVFNFPHVKSKKMKIGLNRDLLRDFFVSCDKLAHSLNNCHCQNDILNCECSFDKVIIPVVSLCAGQSGINEVESVQRSWGDSWQVSDMAAHGNFVCCDIKKFSEWTLASMFKSDYRPSYYRLQTGVSFTTEKALTLTYLHKSHVNPSKTDRLSQIFIFKDEISDDKLISEFSTTFQPISKETVEWSDGDSLPYHHLVYCDKNLDKISDYLGGTIDNSVVVTSDGEIQVTIKETQAIKTVGRICSDVMILYADVLLDTKHDSNYRFVMSQWKNPKSLYPHTHEFHISFWVSRTASPEMNKELFSNNNFIAVLLEVYGLMLKSVEVVEEYKDIKQDRVSLCFKVQIQSLDKALGRITAHQMYLQLRNHLSNRLLVELR